MKILVVGGGGREDALAWKLSQSRLAEKIFIAPGNAGTSMRGENVPISADDIDGLREFALRESVDLTVVGPELPLTMGIVDAFEEAGLKVFGPSRKAAQLEGSKVFSKELMTRLGIPTARYRKFTDPVEARAFVEGLNSQVVIKADGLAAGKGAIVCQTMDEALKATDTIMVKRAFGDAGASVVVEEFLSGEEASFIAVTDGTTVLPLAPAQDHKAIYEGDRGPNTGGMGAYSPAPVVTKAMEREITERIMEPVVRAMKEAGTPYSGVLYAGLMLTENGPMVLEFNCRFGDPEAQPILMRLKNDLVEVLLASVEGKLHEIELDWDDRAAVCVVMASEGYPGSYEKGKEIHGLDEAVKVEDVVVFHAGTAEVDGRIVTAGGRVLGVTGLGTDIGDAIKRTYSVVEMISWEGVYYRRDIGAKALRR